MQPPANRFIKAPVAFRFEVNILFLKNLHARKTANLSV